MTLAEKRGSEAGLGGGCEAVSLCVTGWAAFHSSPVSREKKIASKKGKISLTSEKILKKEELGWKQRYE